jgi:hypothetical protein
VKQVSQANFLLIDGVLRPGANASLYQRDESLEIQPLYIGTRWQALHDLGPILVSVRGSSNLIRETYENTVQQLDACLLNSRAPINIVADHLRRFIAPPDILGGNGLLRYADPLVARYWLGSYQPTHLDAILGPIEAWHVPKSPHSWDSAKSPDWQSFLRESTAPEWLDGYAQLGERQLNALDQAARWRLMERLHLSAEQSHPALIALINKSQLTQWFDQRLDEAKAWGLASERSLAIWIEYSLRWGAGFTQRPNEPYQNWLAHTPNACNLAPELRIQQMDDDCLHIEMNKEV